MGRQTAGAAEHMQREGVRERRGETESERERETAHSYPPSLFSLLPSLRPLAPLRCHSPLSKPPLADPPGCKFLVCGPNTKIPNTSESQAEQLTDSHTCPPTPPQPSPSPILGPTTHLVSFKLNPRKSPKALFPLPFSHLPPIYLYLPPPPFFFP